MTEEMQWWGFLEMLGFDQNPGGIQVNSEKPRQESMVHRKSRFGFKRARKDVTPVLLTDVLACSHTKGGNSLEIPPVAEPKCRVILTMSPKPLTPFNERRSAMMTKTFVSGLLIVMVLGLATATAQVPQMMNYQGVLADSSGNRLDGNYNMTFSVYDTSDGGNPLWVETQYEVWVEQGVFNVLLSIPDSVWYLGEDELVPRRYLGVSISSEPEMVPRREIGSVPYAYRAGGAAAGTPDDDWFYPGDGTTPSTKGYVYLRNDNWGIARNSGSTLWGTLNNTHTNLGVTSTTGTNGQNYGYCTVGGGQSNAAGAENATVAGGLYNIASGSCATVGGGCGDRASGTNATVGGGAGNTASGFYATVGGGWTSRASGEGATVPGGFMNTAAGDYSFASGHRAKANHTGTFVWADGTDADFASTGTNQFLIRASGGVGIGTASPLARLHIAGTSSGDGVLLGSNFRMREYSGNYGPNTFETYFNPLSGASKFVLFGSGQSTMDLIVADGDVGIGTTNPQGAMDVSSTTGALIVPRMTTAQRNALTPVNGMIIYNTTTNQFNFRENGAWVTK